MTDNHLPAATRFIDVDGDRFAYRRWGNTEFQYPERFLKHAIQFLEE
ncbi:hypothetical protein H0A65_15045 [Alcaligenaceae bacterium]|nr:hypothetical protein [Alcaligenaceae bacterium]